MCGIVYAKHFKGHTVNQMVIDRFQAQRSRGTQGFGYFIPGANRLSHNPKEARLLRDLTNHPASEVMFHHRFPTSTDNVKNACHPFSTKTDLLAHQYVMVHNGWLTNDDALHTAHNALGIEYVSMQANGTYNDSEALLYDLALFAEGKIPALTAMGHVAFVMIELSPDGKPLKLHYGRNNSPLMKLEKRGRYLMLASEGKGTPVPADVWYTFDYATGETTNKPLTFPAPVYNWEKYYSKHTATNSQYADYSGGAEYTYWTASRDHFIANSDTTIADKLCHRAGDACPMWDETPSPKAGSPKRRNKSVTERVTEELTHANYDTGLAIENVELDIIGLTNQYNALKAAILDIEDEEERVNDFLEVADEMDEIRDEQSLLALVHAELEAQYEYEDQLGETWRQLMDDDKEEISVSTITDLKALPEPR